MRKRIVYCVGALGLMLSLCACGGEADSVDASPATETTEEATQEAPTEDTEVKEEASQESATETKEETNQESTTENTDTGENNGSSYGDIYMSQIDELVSAGDADLFALVDVDGDDIPELAAISSEGSWDKDQVFLYTYDGEDAVLLASEIGPGMEGHAIGFFEKQNVFVQSGAGMGDAFMFFKIENAQPVQISSFSSFEMIDADDNEISVCTVDDADVTEEEYTKALTEALPTSELTVLASVDTTDMVKYEVSAEDGYLNYTEKEKIPYNSYDEIKEILGSSN